MGLMMSKKDRLRPKLVLIAGLCLTMGAVGVQAQEQGKGTAFSTGERPILVQGALGLNLDPDRTIKDRGIILSNLYERLQAADSKETAERLVSAIEKIWLASGSDTIDVLMGRASTAFENENLKLAKELLDSVTEIAPEYSEGWSKRAIIEFRNKDYVAAMRDLEKVLELDPRHFRAIQGLGAILEEFDKKEKALEAYRRVLKIHPFSDSAQNSEQELSREVEGQRI